MVTPVKTSFYHLAVKPVSKTGTKVYASWNGSTETVAWQVLAGSTPYTLSEVCCMPRNGFETAILVHSAGPYFQVNALDSYGRTIGKSRQLNVF